MKYIRTKDGIYRVTYDGVCYKEAKSQTMLMLVEHKNEKGKIEYEEKTTYITLAMGKNHFKEHILKQANTIEELCDEFVCFKDNKKYICYYDKELSFILEQDGDCRTYKKDYFDTIYGAIWTNKGLIYVAKMNEKGVLELL